jgi:formate hydrogenlyase subunit 6/NADH:ubiquinone oxidoreductase subunit I
VTIRYPEERMEPTDRFRGMFRFSYDRCIACKLCAVACPIDIIYIDVHDDMIEEGGKKKKVKVLDRYDIDVKRCMFCALCEEACPTKPKSIWLTTKTYELASYDRNDLYFNMQQLEYWDDRPQYTGLPEDGEKPQIDETRLLKG